MTGGGEEFTDFNYWREAPLDIGDFSESDSENTTKRGKDKQSLRSEDEGSEGLDEDDQDEMVDSYMSRDSVDEGGDLVESILESMEDSNLKSRSPTDETEDDLVTPDAVLEVSLRTPKDSEGEESGGGIASTAHLDRLLSAEARRSDVAGAEAT